MHQKLLILAGRAVWYCLPRDDKLQLPKTLQQPLKSLPTCNIHVQQQYMMHITAAACTRGWSGMAVFTTSHSSSNLLTSTTAGSTSRSAFH
jgi:hypothetical protein